LDCEVSPLCEAVKVPAFSPKVMPFEFEKMTVPVDWLLAPAEMAMPPPAANVAEAVTVEPFIPNETLFELEKTTVPSLTLPPAAEMAPSPPPVAQPR
jgi:hypothetical protein